MAVGSEHKVDPRYEELMRRRAGKNGTPSETVEEADPEPPAVHRKLDDDGKDVVRAIAGDHPDWSASQIAEVFHGVHGWRPSVQGIGRALAEPARPTPTPRRRPDPATVVVSRAEESPDAEPAAIAAVSRALAPLPADAIRRVLDWARARFAAGDPS